MQTCVRFSLPKHSFSVCGKLCPIPKNDNNEVQNVKGFCDFSANLLSKTSETRSLQRRLSSDQTMSPTRSQSATPRVLPRNCPTCTQQKFNRTISSLLHHNLFQSKTKLFFRSVTSWLFEPQLSPNSPRSKRTSEKAKPSARLPVNPPVHPTFDTEKKEVSQNVNKRVRKIALQSREEKRREEKSLQKKIWRSRTNLKNFCLTHTCFPQEIPLLVVGIELLGKVV